MCHQLFNPVFPTFTQMTLFFDRWSIMFLLVCCLGFWWQQFETPVLLYYQPTCSWTEYNDSADETCPDCCRFSSSFPLILFIAVELHLYKQVTYGKKIHIFAVSSNVTDHVLTAASLSPACAVWLRLILQFRPSPLHCVFVTEAACKPLPHIYMFVLIYSCR